MSQCSQCYSYAINPWHSGRDRKSDVDLCDVCYWRKRADELSDAKAERARYGDTMTSKMGKLEAEIATLRELLADCLPQVRICKKNLSLINQIRAALDTAKDGE